MSRDTPRITAGPVVALSGSLSGKSKSNSLSEQVVQHPVSRAGTVVRRPGNPFCSTTDWGRDTALLAAQLAVIELHQGSRLKRRLRCGPLRGAQYRLGAAATSRLLCWRGTAVLWRCALRDPSRKDRQLIQRCSHSSPLPARATCCSSFYRYQEKKRTTS